MKMYLRIEMILLKLSFISACFLTLIFYDFHNQMLSPFSFSLSSSSSSIFVDSYLSPNMNINMNLNWDSSRSRSDLWQNTRINVGVGSSIFCEKKERGQSSCCRFPFFFQYYLGRRRNIRTQNHITRRYMSNENNDGSYTSTNGRDKDVFDGFENFPGISASYFNTKSSILPNMYSEVLSRISPQEIIMKFYSTAPVRVQLALKSSLVSLMGGLPPTLFKSRVEEDVKQLCSLLFKLQLLGYLFKNADISLARSSSLPSKRVGMSSIPGDKLIKNSEVV